MNAEHFKRAWTAGGDRLIAFTIESLQSVPCRNHRPPSWLNAGLPDSAAPSSTSTGKERGDCNPHLRHTQSALNLNAFFCIGTNDSGDPICIDTGSNGAVVLLSHDDKFRPVQINSSVEKLAESLLAFRTLVDATCELNGEDAFLDGDIPAHLIETLAAELATIDSDSMTERSFWSTEVKSSQEMTA